MKATDKKLPVTHPTALNTVRLKVKAEGYRGGNLRSERIQGQVKGKRGYC